MEIHSISNTPETAAPHVKRSGWASMAATKACSASESVGAEPVGAPWTLTEALTLKRSARSAARPTGLENGESNLENLENLGITTPLVGGFDAIKAEGSETS
jgi:hypothetical protein